MPVSPRLRRHGREQGVDRAFDLGNVCDRFGFWFAIQIAAGIALHWSISLSPSAARWRVGAMVGGLL